MAKIKLTILAYDWHHKEIKYITYRDTLNSPAREYITGTGPFFTAPL